MMTLQWVPPPADRIDACRPLTCTRAVDRIPVANRDVADWMRERTAAAVAAGAPCAGCLSVYTDSWILPDDLQRLLAAPAPAVLVDIAGDPLAWTGGTARQERPDDGARVIDSGTGSFRIRYPWDLLQINERLVGTITTTRIEGDGSPGCGADAVITVGPGTRILPGVYVEGKVIIGAGCKIGPNCYLRGNTSIGDGCHIGQAVELKNVLIMRNVSIGHLSYCGDSVIGEKVNFGAGTVTANLRHDGRTHRVPRDGQPCDTGRRKLGTIMGDGVHTGIHTSIYPGRMFWPHTATRPGAIVDRDITG